MKNAIVLLFLLGSLLFADPAWADESCPDATGPFCSDVSDVFVPRVINSGVPSEDGDALEVVNLKDGGPPVVVHKDEYDLIALTSFSRDEFVRRVRLVIDAHRQTPVPDSGFLYQ